MFRQSGVSAGDGHRWTLLPDKFIYQNLSQIDHNWTQSNISRKKILLNPSPRGAAAAAAAQQMAGLKSPQDCY